MCLGVSLMMQCLYQRGKKENNINFFSKILPPKCGWLSRFTRTFVLALKILNFFSALLKFSHLKGDQSDGALDHNLCLSFDENFYGVTIYYYSKSTRALRFNDSEKIFCTPTRLIKVRFHWKQVNKKHKI